MKSCFVVLALAPNIGQARQWIKCEDSQWAHKGKCLEMVGFAKDHIELPDHAIEFSTSFYHDLQTRDRVFKLQRLLRHDIKHALALQSMKKSNGRKSCLKEVSSTQLSAIEKVADNDFYYDNYGTARIDYGEMYLENLFHLLFEPDCKSRLKLQKRLDKLLAQLQKHCRSQCRALGFDYFYHVPDDTPVDYFQSYYDIHDGYDDILGDDLYSLN